MSINFTTLRRARSRARTIAALVTGTPIMGQVQRALNRIYGIESDRPSLREYGHAFLMALTAGTLAVLALGSIGPGGVLARSFGTSTARTLWRVARWPVSILLLIAAVASTLLLGAALAAQLEAVRAGVTAPRSATKTAESEPRSVVADGEPGDRFLSRAV